MWGLNKILLNNQWVKQEFKREVKIYLETNENRNTVYWKMGGLKHIILNETSQTEKNKYCMVSHMRYLKRSNSQKQKVQKWLQGPRSQGNRESLWKGTSFQFIRWIGSENLMHRMLVIGNNTVLYNWNFSNNRT